MWLVVVFLFVVVLVFGGVLLMAYAKGIVPTRPWYLGLAIGLSLTVMRIERTLTSWL